MQSITPNLALASIKLLILILILTLFPQKCNAQSPRESVSVAVKDAITLPTEVGHKTRYLTLYNMTDDEIAESIKVLAFQVNILSREVDIVRPRRVSRYLLAIDSRHYLWNLAVWERFKDIDPYFHVKVKREYIDGVGYYRIPGDESSWVWTKKENKTIETFDHAPWIEAEEIDLLSKITGSSVPIVRGDWFFFQTAIQKGRIAGYYDFLELKSRDDFQKLVGLDKELAQRMRKEIAGIVEESGVTINNRQIFRFQTVSGCYIETRDVKDQKDQRNALNQLDNNYKHDAEEIYGVLANELFAFYLSDDKGVQADTAPDFIASDNRSTNNDPRVHVPLGCVRCHIEGLRPINDWARRTFNKNSLVSPVFEVQKRLQQLYLSPLEEKLNEDNQRYARALLRVNGLSPSENASAYGRVWSRYVDTRITPQIAARDLGVSEFDFVNAIRSLPPPIDPQLIALGSDPPVPIKREHWEQLFSTAMQIMNDYRPIPIVPNPDME